MLPERIRILKSTGNKKGPVVYWMSREQRAHDNWALLYAQGLSIENKQPLIVIFCLVPDFLNATIRQYDFMLKGLKEVEASLQKFKIPFVLLNGMPHKEIPEFIKIVNAAMLITDFDPLRIKRKWKESITEAISIPFHEVDAHNIVPAFHISGKEEFGAYTLRPKINRALPAFMDEFPLLKKMKTSADYINYTNDWVKLEKSLKIDFSVKPVNTFIPGEKAALKTMDFFLSRKIKGYDLQRNDPLKDAQSNLSAYLHFGQISAQRIALNIGKMNLPVEVTQSYLEELIVRRELSDNFCMYNENYDNFSGFRPWARITLNEHKRDEREYVYSKKDFENASTHEDLWNAAQKELLLTGKMHGFMRMYWAKKILEWSVSPEEALDTAIYLNDKYELDGRDPNGYAGCAWAVGGTHDRAWGERPVFGKIRYMNCNGCKRKFDIDAYIDMFK